MRMTRTLAPLLTVSVLLLGACGAGDSDSDSDTTVSSDAQGSDAQGYELPMKLACQALESSTPEPYEGKSEEQALALVREGLTNLVGATGGAGVNISDLEMDTDFRDSCPEVRERALAATGKDSLDAL